MSTNVIPPSEPNRCVVCGAPVSYSNPAVCWLCCGKSPTELRESSVAEKRESSQRPPIWPPLRPPPLPPPERENFSFTLGTLMLAMTLITVLCGLITTAPMWGYPLAIACMPAWVRASCRLSADPRTRDNPTLGDKLKSFFVSLGIVLLVGAATFVAFDGAIYVVCSQVMSSH